MRKLGFFGGTFDPIHIGHLYLAMELKEKAGLDEVLFCPAYCSPFKTETPPAASAEDRYEMVRRALLPFPFFRPLRCEIERAGPSYTIDTVRALKKEGDASLFLLLSEEAARHVLEWKEADALLKLAEPLIGGRDGAGLPSSLQKSFCRTPLLEVSSTQIRKRLSQALCCAHLVPLSVLSWIEERKIYLGEK